ncbi:hypothetical protein ACOMHN_066168 [Nucella lapillus]
MMIVENLVCHLLRHSAPRLKRDRTIILDPDVLNACQSSHLVTDPKALDIKVCIVKPLLLITDPKRVHIHLSHLAHVEQAVEEGDSKEQVEANIKTTEKLIGVKFQRLDPQEGTL